MPAKGARDARERLRMTMDTERAFTAFDPHASNSAGVEEQLTKRQQKMLRDDRVVCSARRRSDGQPCQALSVPGKKRCKWHGGCSTGPRTIEGKARTAANLRRARETRSSLGIPTKGA